MATFSLLFTIYVYFLFERYSIIKRSSSSPKTFSLMPTTKKAKARPLRLRQEATTNGKHKYYIRSKNVNFYFPEGLSKEEALKRALKLRTRKRRRKPRLVKKSPFQLVTSKASIQSIMNPDGTISHNWNAPRNYPMIQYRDAFNESFNRNRDLQQIYYLLEKENLTDTDRRNLIETAGRFGFQMPNGHNKASRTGLEKLIKQFKAKQNISIDENEYEIIKLPPAKKPSSVVIEELPEEKKTPEKPKPSKISDFFQRLRSPSRSKSTKPSPMQTPSLTRSRDILRAVEEDPTDDSFKSRRRVPMPEPIPMPNPDTADDIVTVEDAPDADGSHDMERAKPDPEKAAEIKADEKATVDAVVEATVEEEVGSHNDRFKIPNYKSGPKLYQRLAQPIDDYPKHQRNLIVNTATISSDLIQATVQRLNVMPVKDLVTLAESYGLSPDPSWKYKAPLIELIMRNSASVFTDTLPNPQPKKRAKGKAKVENSAATDNEEDQPSRSLTSIKHTGLYDSQINDLMESYKDKGYLGCICRDQIDMLIPISKQFNKFGFIMNTDTSHGEGLHWVGVYLDTMEDGELCYFDPFGDDPPEDFPTNIKALIDAHELDWYLKFKINRLVQQDARSSTCGMHSLLWLRKMLDGKSFVETTGWDVRKNEKIAQKCIKKYSRFGYI